MSPTATPLPDLVELFAAYRTNSLDPVTVLATCNERIITANGNLGAVVALDLEGAEQAATASADRWANGVPRSSIDGAPILVKANIAVAGLPCHAGIAAYVDHVATDDALCVARLRDAGAVIMGLTNMDEAALGAEGDNPWLGRTNNPHRSGFSAGGPSGGSAAAVAAGFCVAAFGTDTIGSIVIPASYCGVVGHRASRALLAVDGIMPLSPSLDHVGWHASSTTGSAMLSRALGGSRQNATHLRFGTLNLDGFVLDDVVATAHAKVVAALGQADFTVPGSIVPPSVIDRLSRLLFEIAEVEAAAFHAPMIARHPTGFSPRLSHMLAWGAGKGAQGYPGHLERLGVARASLRELLADVDVLLLPATPNRAFAFDGPGTRDPAAFASVAACLGWPATAFPIGQADGLPLSVLVISENDAASLAAAALVEDVLARCH